MKWEILLQIASTIIIALGGGSAIVMAVTKWCGNLLSQKLLGNIQNKYEKEIETYKAKLQMTSAKLDAYLQNSMHIIQNQYNMEVDIYKKIWSSLYELLGCLDYIYDFENVTVENEVMLRELQNRHYQDLKQKLKIFEKDVIENAPFYQKEAYDNLIGIEKQFQNLEEIFGKYRNEISRLERDSFIANNQEICNKVEVLKEELVNNVRTYLNRLKTIQN